MKTKVSIIDINCVFWVVNLVSVNIICAPEPQPPSVCSQVIIRPIKGWDGDGGSCKVV